MTSSQLQDSAVTGRSRSSKARLWTGWTLWVLAVPFMLFDAGLHIANPPFVAEYARKFGLAPNLMTPLGLIELLGIVLYVLPRTAALGALLLTGYLGGAVETQIRMGGSFAFPVIVAALLWGSLLCRNDRVLDLFRK